jgi:hypothetical protein
MRMLPFGVRTRAAQRSRRLWGSGERQTEQSQPSIGTPVEVPVPRKVKERVAAMKLLYTEFRRDPEDRA